MPSQEAQQLPTFSNFRIISLATQPLSLLTSHISSLINIHTDSTPLPTSHYLYIRPHETRKIDPELPAGRTLFISNLPVDASLSHLSRLFRRCGTIEKVIYRDSQVYEKFNDFVPNSNLKEISKSGGKAHVIFKEDDAIEKVLGMKDRKRIWVPQDQTNENLGISKWISEYLDSFPDSSLLETQINQELIEFEENEKRMRLEKLAKSNLPDSDGFITVTRNGKRNTNRDGKGYTVTASNPEEIKDLKPKDHSLEDFYRFQMKEKKRNQLIELRKKFEEDKSKIEELKRKRKFKPY